MKKISVVIPVFNAEKYIRRCVECLFAQTMAEDMEFIFVNDMSTDKTGLMLKSFRENAGDKMIFIEAERKLGPGGARNLGMKMASGEYIGFMDCDDIIESFMYEKLYDKAVKSNSDIVECRYLDESKNNEICMSYTQDLTGILDDGKRSEIITRGGYIWNKIFKTSLIKENNCYFRENVIYEDLDFLIRIIAYAGSIEAVAEVLYKYMNNEGSANKEKDQQKWINDVIVSIPAVYECVSGYKGYQNIKDAVEYIMLSMYGCGLNLCLVNQDNKQFELISNLRKLKKMKKRYIHNYKNNIYVLERMDKDMLGVIEWAEKLKI